MDILLSFDDEDRPLRRDGLPHTGKAVEHGRNTFESPNPPALAIGPPLPELVSGKAHDLIEQRSVGVGIVIGRQDLWEPLAVRRGLAVRRQFSFTKSEGCADCLKAALWSSPALEEGTAVPSGCDREARVRVLMGWAQRLPMVPVLFHSLETIQDFLNTSHGAVS
jgi:hypothetical protein